MSASDVLETTSLFGVQESNSSRPVWTPIQLLVVDK